MREQQADYDSPWKEILSRYFKDFMAFFFAQAHQDIDWAKGHEFLDKELQQIASDAAVGPRRVDKLAKVWRKDGAEAWVLIHVEVQSQEEAEFAERMYVYNYRLFDRYHRQVASLAVLADERVGWRPDHFGYELWGCQVGLTFPTVKLLDYRQQWAALEQSNNPFAMVVMAYLKAQETSGNEAERLAWKLSLVRQLYARGYKAEDVRNLFQFIDWVMQLPQALEQAFWQEVQQYEEEKRMRYITSVERIGLEKGLRQGLLMGIEMGLEIRFGQEGRRLLPEIRKVEDVLILQAISQGLKSVKTPDELRRIYQQMPPVPLADAPQPSQQPYA